MVGHIYLLEACINPSQPHRSFFSPSFKSVLGYIEKYWNRSHLSVYLFTYLSIYLPIYLSIYLSIYGIYIACSFKVTNSRSSVDYKMSWTNPVGESQAFSFQTSHFWPV